MTNPSQSSVDESLVLSYLGLRKAIGIIAIALPLALVIGMLVLCGPGIESSISTYYHTIMGDVLVGSLCAIAVFLLSYRGYERQDDIAGDLACFFAAGVALFPVKPDASPTGTQEIIGVVHYVFAAALFLALAFFSLVQFRKGDKTKKPTPRKLLRNRVYTICGYAILACIALVGVTKLLSDESPIMSLSPVFWLETIAIWAFGCSWFTKGEGVLKDDEA